MVLCEFVVAETPNEETETAEKDESDEADTGEFQFTCETIL